MSNSLRVLSSTEVLKPEIVSAIPKVMIVGFGQMGGFYRNILSDLGYKPDQILVCDTNPAQLAKVQGATPMNKVRDGWDQQPQAVFVTTNTHAHLPVLQEAVESGVKNIYVEKPIVEPSQLEVLAHLLQQHHDVRVLVGYVINASPVMDALVDHMREHDLHVLSSIGRWGKRRGNTRPTAGNHVDEIIHMLMAHYALVKSTQNVAGFGVDSVVRMKGHSGFYNVEKQSGMYGTQHLPDSTTQGAIHLETDRLEGVPLLFQSSFVLGEQMRNIVVHLGNAQGQHTHTANMHFDKKIEGKVTDTGTVIGESDGTLEVEWSAPNVNKLRSLTVQALSYFANPNPTTAAKVTTYAQDQFGEDMLKMIDTSALDIEIGKTKA